MPISITEMFPPKKRQRTIDSDVDAPVWIDHGGMWSCDFNSTPNSRVACFDMDGTLIKTKSGKVNPVDENDWELFDQNVLKVVRKFAEHSQEPFRIIIFSNQKKMGSDHVVAAQLKKKVETLQKKLNVPLLAMLAYDEAYFRKPCTGMWDALCKKFSPGIKIDMKRSFYVGDAAGRPKRGSIKKDFSAADVRFAHNIGLDLENNFHVPERIFKNNAKEHELIQLVGVDDHGAEEFDPRALLPNTVVCKDARKNFDLLKSKCFDLPNDFEFSEKQEVLVMCGPPGSGKSSISRILEAASRDHTIQYHRLAGDEVGGRHKLAGLMKNILNEGHSVIIDATNPTPASQKEWLAVAKSVQPDCESRILFVETPKEAAFHFIAARMNIPHSDSNLRKELKIPSMVVHKWYKDFELEKDAIVLPWSKRLFFVESERVKLSLTSFVVG